MEIRGKGKQQWGVAKSREEGDKASLNKLHNQMIALRLRLSA